MVSTESLVRESSSASDAHELADYKDFNAINIDGLQQAFNYYCSRRHSRVEAPLSGNFAPSIADQVSAHYELLETITPDQTGLQATPILTVAIPASILGESIRNVVRTVGLVQAERARCNGNLNVVLWANTRYKSPRFDKAAITAAAQSRYAELRSQLNQLIVPGVRIRSGLQILERPHLRMGEVRANHMEAVAVDAMQQGLGYNHPVLWLDADTTFIRPGSFQQIVESVAKLDSNFVHANTQYSLDWASRTPLAELDPTSKAVAIAEIMRRHFTRSGLEREYDEESGLAFALGTYLFARGVPATTRIGEAAKLVEAATHNHPVQQSEILLALTSKTELETSIHYVPSAHIGMSARRHYELAHSKGAAGLYYPDGGAYAQPFSNRRNPTAVGATSTRPASITAKDMQQLLGVRLEYAEISLGRPLTANERHKLQQPITKLIARYF